jgi:hypothetical protein
VANEKSGAGIVMFAHDSQGKCVIKLAVIGDETALWQAGHAAHQLLNEIDPLPATGPKSRTSGLVS